MQKIGVIQTYKRRIKSFRNSLPTILNQGCDTYYIYLGDYTTEDLSEFEFPENCIVETGENQPSFYRFKYAEKHRGEEVLMFFYDDDLGYPEYHTEGLSENLKMFPDTIFSYGGSQITFPLNSYYKDRISYLLLETHESVVNVDIINTVCGINLYFHKNFNVYSTNLSLPLDVRQSSDLLLSVYAKMNNYPLVMLPHIGESYVNYEDENSLWLRLHINETEIVQYLKSNRSLFTYHRGRELPLVSVIVVNSRNNDWVAECYKSIKNTYYPNLEIIEVENIGKAVTIGKAFNDGVRKAKGKYVLFVGDDDFIGFDYVSKLVLPFEYMLTLRNDIVCSTSYTSFIEGDKVTKEDAVPTGMWLREFLLQEPFKEYLTHQVDTEIFERIKKQNKGIICNKDYGYFYRCHDGQSSGKKTAKGKINNDAIEFVNNLI